MSGGRSRNPCVHPPCVVNISAETRTCVVEDKAGLRQRFWNALEQAGAARFPGTRGRIPNFIGAEAAANHLTTCAAWQCAPCIKCNPDSAQRPVRHAALAAGKIVYMAVPKLAERRPFIELDPAGLSPQELWKASSIRGAAEVGRRVTLNAMPQIDLIVTGCVAVTREGARLGKGGGYSDLEYGLLREAGKIGDGTLVATTVHPAQIAPDGAIPMTSHDISLDLIATPTELICCLRPFARPRGILWDELAAEKRAAIPVLRLTRRRAP
jgi:5-formyltetrahydrofolate cyclo-ligase